MTGNLGDGLEGALLRAIAPGADQSPLLMILFAIVAVAAAGLIKILLRRLSEIVRAWIAPPDAPFVPFTGGAWLSKAREAKSYRRNVWMSAVASLVLMVVLLGSTLFQPSLPLEWKASVERTCWAVYDPQAFDPRQYKKTSNRFYAPHLTGLDWSYQLRQLLAERLGFHPEHSIPGYGPDDYRKTIGRDLDLIRRAGFTGVVTHGAYGPLGLVPEIARKKGLKVLMGVWDVGNVDELNVAASQASFVQGYVVGFGGLSNSAPIAAPDAQPSAEMIEKSLARLRRRAHRPVATQLHFWDLGRFPTASAMGDWVFVDPNDPIPEEFIKKFPSEYAHLENSGAGDQTGRLLNHIKLIKDFAKDRPYLLSTATFPAMGSNGEKNQANYFSFLIDKAPDLLDTGPIPFATHTAFDAWWKGPPFADWERFTGVLRPSGWPRPAARVLATRCESP